MDDVTLTTTICQLLADRCGWAWRPTGPAYTTSDVGVFYGALGTAPDRAAGVTFYWSADPFTDGDVPIRRVQVRFRGARNDSTDADRLAGAAFTALHGLARVAGLSLVRRVLVAHLGADTNARQERADTYELIIDNPEASS